MEDKKKYCPFLYDKYTSLVSDEKNMEHCSCKEDKCAWYDEECHHCVMISLLHKGMIRV